MKPKVPRGPNGPSNKPKSQCYRCGMTGHWAKVCRIAKHLCDLYQASLKEKGKEVETNLVTNDDPPMAPLDLDDIFADNIETVGDYAIDDNVHF